jgi:hypothetical protein
MSQVVQAQCPHCGNVLRIPEEWLSRSMRCKFCKKAFQARSKNSVSASANASASAPPPVAKAGIPIPVGRPANLVQHAAPTLSRPGPGGPFSFPENQGSPSAPGTARPRNNKGRGSLLLVMTFFFLFALGATGAGFVVHKVLSTPLGPLNSMPLAKNNDKTDALHPVVSVVPRDLVKDNKDLKAIDVPKEKEKPRLPKVEKAPAPQEMPKKNVPINDPPKKKPPPKIDVKKEPPKKDVVVVKPPTPPPFTNDPFPRRALLISVNNYLMFNTVHYGSAQDAFKRGYPGSSTGVLRDRLTRPPMNFPATQVVELSDGVPEGKAVKAHTTQKSVLETTIKDFVDTSREQDRIVLLFAGHATYLDEAKKAYLIPLDGNISEPDTLLPLSWVYDQLAKCKAQQKVLILDVFRYSPSRGFELPGAGDGDEGTMPEGFDKELLNPPAGVQVWSSCVKDQSAVEHDGGSAFLQALCFSLQGGAEMTGFSGPTQPLPFDILVPKVNQRLKELLTSAKRTQLSRLTGKDTEGGAKFDPQEPAPPPLTLKPPTVAGGMAAGLAQVNNILDEMSIFPPVRETRASNIRFLKGESLPAFAATKLDDYKQEGSVNELHNVYKANKEAFAKGFPLRAAYFEALEKLQESGRISMREDLRSPIDPKRKAAFLQEQEPMGKSIFFLEQTLAQVKEVAAQRDKETSKRWQANFDFMQARLQSRLIYLFEYNYTIGQIRADNLPELAAGQSGWRIGTQKKISVPEQKAKALMKDTTKLWKAIQKDHPGTPWAVIAQRESMISLGLQWRPKSD